VQYVASVSAATAPADPGGSGFHGSFSYYSVPENGGTGGGGGGGAASVSEDGYYGGGRLSRRRSSTVASAAGEPPVTVQEWQKGELLGQGSFGKVYLGLCTDTGLLMAVKQVGITAVEPGGAVGEELLTLQQEINVIRNLRHENIVRYYGTAVSDGFLNIFLEYVPGGSLRSLINRFGKLNESLTRVYTRQILEGLDYLHRKRVIHRDIKGANILVDDKGRIKLADFGASRSLAGLVSLNEGLKSVRGSPYWMAPEVIKQSGYGRQADIWSVGCVVVEMAMGEPPFSRYKTQISALFHIASTEEMPDFPGDFSDPAIDFLCQCFRRDPGQRPNAAQLLAHPWLSGGGGGGGGGARVSPVSEAGAEGGPAGFGSGSGSGSGSGPLSPQIGAGASPTTPGFQVRGTFSFDSVASEQSPFQQRHDHQQQQQQQQQHQQQHYHERQRQSPQQGQLQQGQHQQGQQQQGQQQQGHQQGHQQQQQQHPRAPRPVHHGHSVSKSTVDEFIRQKVETDAARMVRSIRESVERTERLRRAGPSSAAVGGYGLGGGGGGGGVVGGYPSGFPSGATPAAAHHSSTGGGGGGDSADERERERKREVWEREIMEAMNSTSGSSSSSSGAGNGDGTAGASGSVSATKSKGRAVRSGRGAKR
jgi:serine/threonine protein kinase